MTFEVRTSSQPAALVNMARAVVDGIDRELPIFDVRTQVEQIDATLSQQRMFAALTSAFGLLAVILASIGIYGVIAGSVASRVPEIGVRMALGAGQGQVLTMILREAGTLGLLGIVVGGTAAALLVKYIASFLYNLTPFDPVSAGSADPADARHRGDLGVVAGAVGLAAGPDAGPPARIETHVDTTLACLPFDRPMKSRL